MVNATINTSRIIVEAKGNLIISRFIELIKAPIDHHNMIWIVLPLIAGLFMMQLYFGRYRKEELGWNTAVGNSLALIFVSVDLIRQIYILNPAPTFDFVFLNFSKLIIVIVIGLWAGWLLLGEFFHLLPKKFAFLVSSSLPTTLIAYIAIILVYTAIPFDFATFIAGIMLLIVLSIFFSLLHILQPISLKE